MAIIYEFREKRYTTIAYKWKQSNEKAMILYFSVLSAECFVCWISNILLPVKAKDE